MLTRKPNLVTRWALAGALSFTALGAVSCGTEGPESGADVEDVQEAPEETETSSANPFDGPYDQEFVDDLDVREGQTVTISAELAASCRHGKWHQDAADPRGGTI